MPTDNQPISETETNGSESLSATLDRWQARQSKKLDELETHEQKMELLEKNNAVLDEVLARVIGIAERYDIDLTA